MTFDRNVCNRNACLAAAALAAGIVAAAPADARPIHDRFAAYLFPCATYDRIGDGPFQYRRGCEAPAFRSRRHRHAAHWR
jgi:hypothetical protein